MAPDEVAQLMAQQSAIAAEVHDLGVKLDAVHRSLATDIEEGRRDTRELGARVGRNELRLARLQGAGAALTFGLPFIALGLQVVMG